MPGPIAPGTSQPGLQTPSPPFRHTAHPNRHQLSLFAHISKISWQFDDESRVCGTVSDPDHADVRPFDLPIDTPTFEVTNKLWSLMSEAVN